jgi:hypothetical protein
MTTPSRKSRIKGHRPAAGRVDSKRKWDFGLAESKQHPGGGPIAVSGDKHQGQCGTQQSYRGKVVGELFSVPSPHSSFCSYLVLYVPFSRREKMLENSCSIDLISNVGSVFIFKMINLFRFLKPFDCISDGQLKY